MVIEKKIISGHNRFKNSVIEKKKKTTTVPAKRSAQDVIRGQT